MTATTHLIVGKPPRKKPVHHAKHVNQNGDVSALCFEKPRPIDLSKATWTNRAEAVTCKKCMARQEMAVDRGALQ